MKSRETIHYTIELRLNGNFNIYEGDTCTARTLKWSNISPAGTAEVLGSWVITWAENAKHEQNKDS